MGLGFWIQLFAGREAYCGTVVEVVDSTVVQKCFSGLNLGQPWAHGMIGMPLIEYREEVRKLVKITTIIINFILTATIIEHLRSCWVGQLWLTYGT